jgi:hypothetical protein
MSGLYDLDSCRYGQHCRTRVQDGTMVRPGPADGRGLCPPDEANGRHAIRQLPDLHARVLALVPKDAGRQGIGSLTGGGHGSAKVDPPTPLNLEMDALACQIVYLLEIWAIPVWDLAVGSKFRELSTPQHWTAGQAADLLTANYQVLRSLTATSYAPYDQSLIGSVAPEDDGPGAIVMLARLAQRARSVVGEDQRLERRAMPCPKPYPDPDPKVEAVYGCGLEGTLVRRIGPDPTIFCTNCGWWCSPQEYEQYMLTEMLRRDRWLPPRTAAA